MAKMTTSGIDDVFDVLKNLELLGDGEVIDEVLTAGSDEIKKAWQDEIQKQGFVDTGDMLNSVDSTRVTVNVSEIYPQGTDRKGVRNAEKAFCLHYGVGHGKRAKRRKYKNKHTIKASHFVDNAEKNAEEKVVSAMQNALDKFVDSME